VLKTGKKNNIWKPLKMPEDLQESNEGDKGRSKKYVITSNDRANFLLAESLATNFTSSHYTSFHLTGKKTVSSFLIVNHTTLSLDSFVFTACDTHINTFKREYYDDRRQNKRPA
jgi:hypothetical protein